MRRIAREALNVLLIAAGILSAGMGLHGFLLSSRFIDGGVTGISMLLAEVAGWPIALLIPLFNLPFIALGYRQMGRAFAVRSALAIAGLAVCLATVHYPDVTPDRLLTAVFGGFFIGAGVGLAMRGGAVLDGTEIAALLISRRSSVVRVSDVILALNVVIFLCAAYFLGVESALYSILTYVAASRTLDFILHGIEEYHAVTIVSDESEAIRRAVTEGLDRAVTVLHGAGGATGTPRDVLYCVVTRLEIGQVRAITLQIDPGAFLVVHALADVHGGRVKRPPLHAAVPDTP
ncbi:MAG TPA: YitT family protein [Longimicrobiaceae bacterium]|nr:YitT family protein [Longimicrobiaceae bacterium]